MPSPTTDGLIALFSAMEDCGFRLVHAVDKRDDDDHVEAVAKHIRRNWPYINEDEIERIVSAINRNAIPAHQYVGQ